MPRRSLVIAAILGFFGQASNKCIVVDPPKKKGGCCSRPFSESRKCKDYQVNLTIICRMRWPIVFVAYPKLEFVRVPLLLNVSFKFWSLLRNVRFGWFRKLLPEKRN